MTITLVPVNHSDPPMSIMSHVGRKFRKIRTMPKKIVIFSVVSVSTILSRVLAASPATRRATNKINIRIPIAILKTKMSMKVEIGMIGVSMMINQN